MYPTSNEISKRRNATYLTPNITRNLVTVYEFRIRINVIFKSINKTMSLPSYSCIVQWRFFISSSVSSSVNHFSFLINHLINLILVKTQKSVQLLQISLHFPVFYPLISQLLFTNMRKLPKHIASIPFMISSF